MTESHPFQPEIQVIVVDRMGGEIYVKATTKVIKIFKNGNFILEDENYKGQQWKAVKWSDSQSWHGCRTGDHGWRDTVSVRIADDEMRAEIAESRVRRDRIRRANDILSKIRELRANQLTDEQIHSLENVFKKPEVETER